MLTSGLSSVFRWLTICVSNVVEILLISFKNFLSNPYIASLLSTTETQPSRHYCQLQKHTTIAPSQMKHLINFYVSGSTCESDKPNDTFTLTETDIDKIITATKGDQRWCQGLYT